MGVPFHVATKVPFLVAISRYVPQRRVRHQQRPVATGVQRRVDFLDALNLDFADTAHVVLAAHQDPLGRPDRTVAYLTATHTI